MIVVAEPDADNERIVKPDKPGIAIVLGRSGLAGRKAP
jgi:hypothetical protein